MCEFVCHLLLNMVCPYHVLIIFIWFIYLLVGDDEDAVLDAEVYAAVSTLVAHDKVVAASGAVHPVNHTSFCFSPLKATNKHCKYISGF